MPFEQYSHEPCRDVVLAPAQLDSPENLRFSHQRDGGWGRVEDHGRTSGKTVSSCRRLSIATLLYLPIRTPGEADFRWMIFRNQAWIERAKRSLGLCHDI
jgi:hypothetical protein